MRYEEIPELSPAEVEAAIGRDDPGELLHAVLAAALRAADAAWAEDVCVRLSRHPHFNVRGNAVLGFGHIARIHGTLTRARVRPILEAALRDEHEYVRAQADSAASDTRVFLGWEIAGLEDDFR